MSIKSFKPSKISLISAVAYLLLNILSPSQLYAKNFDVNPKSKEVAASIGHERNDINGYLGFDYGHAWSYLNFLSTFDLRKDDRNMDFIARFDGKDNTWLIPIEYTGKKVNSYQSSTTGTTAIMPIQNGTSTATSNEIQSLNSINEFGNAGGALAYIYYFNKGIFRIDLGLKQFWSNENSTNLTNNLSVIDQNTSEVQAGIPITTMSHQEITTDVTNTSSSSTKETDGKTRLTYVMNLGETKGVGLIGSLFYSGFQNKVDGSTTVNTTVNGSTEVNVNGNIITIPNSSQNTITNNYNFSNEGNNLTFSIGPTFQLENTSDYLDSRIETFIGPNISKDSRINGYVLYMHSWEYPFLALIDRTGTTTSSGINFFTNEAIYDKLVEIYKELYDVKNSFASDSLKKTTTDLTNLNILRALCEGARGKELNLTGFEYVTSEKNPKDQENEVNTYSGIGAGYPRLGLAAIISHNTSNDQTSLSINKHINTTRTLQDITAEVYTNDTATGGKLSYSIAF